MLDHWREKELFKREYERCYTCELRVERARRQYWKKRGVISKKRIPAEIPDWRKFWQMYFGVKNVSS